MTATVLGVRGDSVCAPPTRHLLFVKDPLPCRGLLVGIAPALVRLGPVPGASTLLAGPSSNASAASAGGGPQPRAHHVHVLRSGVFDRWASLVREALGQLVRSVRRHACKQTQKVPVWPARGGARQGGRPHARRARQYRCRVAAAKRVGAVDDFLRLELLG